MEEHSIYLSLQEATKYCNYSQEYLSLRARQGKLKAMKFGRNWVTKKEWLEEYFKTVEEYNNNITIKKFVAPPKNLPIEKEPSFLTFFEEKLHSPALRSGFVTALVFILVTAGVTFGKESFKNVFEITSERLPLVVRNINKTFDKEVSNLTLGAIKSFGQSFSNVAYQAADIGGMFDEYGQWISRGYFVANDWVEGELEELVSSYKIANDFVEEKISTFGSQVSKSYFAANDFVEEKITEGVQGLKEGYFTANEFLEEKLTQGYQMVTQPFIRAYKFLTSPWRITLPEKIAIEEGVKKEELEAMKKEVESLKGEGIVAKELTKEVSKITQIEPIKEVTKEIKTIDDLSIQQLKTLQAQVDDLETDMARRPTGLIASPAMIQPVSQQSYFPKLYVENGQIILEVAGSGNISFTAPNNITASSQNFIIGGNLIVAGTQTFAANSASSALTVVQNGTGNIVEFKDGGTTVFAIADGGYATFAIDASTTPAVLIRAQDTDWVAASSTYFAIAGTSTFDGRFIDIQKAGTSLFYIDGSGNIVSAGNVDIAGAIYQPVYGTDDGLVLYLPFSEGYYATTSATTTTVYDRSPYGNDGTVYSGEASTTAEMWADGKYGQALSFDGVDDYVNCGNGASLNPGTGDFTYEFWAKSSQSDAWVEILNKGNSSGYSSLTEGWYITIRSDYDYVVYTHTAWANAVYWVGPGSYFEDGIWHHWVFIGNRTAGTVELFKDGVSQGTKSPGGNFATQNITTNESLSMGARVGNRPYNGLIDEARIYNRALSADEIKTHYLRGQTTYGLVQADSFRIINTSNTVNFQLDSSGNAVFTGTIAAATTTITGDLLPATTTLYNLGSDTYKWANIYAATGTFGGTITINSTDITSSAALNINSGAASTWTTNGLTIQSTGNITATSTGDIALHLGDDAGTKKFYVKDSAGIAQLTLDSNGYMDITGAMYQPVYASDDGLVGYWPFSEGYYATTSATTTTVYDRSPYGNDGIVYSGEASTTAEMWANGKYGQALSFDGVDDQVSFGTPASLANLLPVTFEAWVYFNSIAGDYKTIFGRPNNRPWFGVYGTRFQAIRDYVTTDAFSYTTGTGELMYAGSWFHVVLVCAADNKLYLYRNGVEVTLEGQIAGVGGLVNDSADVLYLGKSLVSNPLNGLIDEVRIYNRALSADEIKAHYLRGATTYGLVQADSFRIIDTSNTVNFQLDSSGNAVFTGSLTAQGMSGTDFTGPITITTSTQPQLEVRYDAGNKLTVSVGATGAVTASSTATTTLTTAGNVNQLVLGDNGNVGIGTANPQYTLDIVGNSALWQSVYGTDDGLVLYMPFSEGYYATTSATTTTVYDRSPYGNDGTVYSGEASTTAEMWANGKYGQALSFDGVDDYVDFGKPVSLNNLSEITYEFWIYQNAYKDYTWFVNKNWKYISQDHTGVLDARIYTDATRAWSISGIVLPLNQWVHVVTTYSNSGDRKIRFYFNGAEINSYSTQQAATGTLFDDSGTNLIISSVTYTINGAIDEARIYNRALSADEIKTQYLRGSQAPSVVQAQTFRILDTSNNIPFMVAASGYVGIGTAGPEVLLDVVKAQNSGTTIRVLNTTSGTGAFAEITSSYNIDGTGVHLYAFSPGYTTVSQYIADSSLLESNKSLGISALGNNPIQFWTNSLERVRIDGSGNVGIGTISPAARLDVYASSTATTTYIYQEGTGAAFVVRTQNVAEAFVVKEPNITMNLPLQVNVEGNVGFAYDIEFTDPDLAKILSNGTLAIEAGTPGRLQDLSLKTRGTGNIVADISNAAAGIGGFKVLGSSGLVMRAGEPQVEFYRPISVDVGGDVGFDYDIYFANGGPAQITSAGPLAILAGDPNHAENLTLGTQGTGDVIVDIVDSAATYGGFKVIGSDSGSYVVRISPDGDVYIGGTGSAGSDLWVKQNITQRGGTMTIQPLNPAESEMLSASEVQSGTGDCTAGTTFYYRLTAFNDNGETTPSAPAPEVIPALSTSTISVAWNPIEGATKYKLYRNTGKLVEDCEDVWDAGQGASTTVSTSTDKKVGTYSVQVAATTTADVGLLAYENFASIDLSTRYSILFWVKSSITTNRGDLKLLVDEENNCTSSEESLDIPALEANTWKFVKLSFANTTTTRDAVLCVGLSLATDQGGQDIYIDGVNASADDDKWVGGNSSTYILSPSTSYTDTCTTTDTSSIPPTQNNTGGKVTVYRGADYYGSEATTTAFSVTEATVNIGYPLNVTTGGDVGISYDLAFLNTGASYITSAGPLWIQAGSPNIAQNLVLTVAGETGKDSGDVIVDVRYSNQTYGGFKVIGSDGGGFVFKISPSGDVEIGGTGSGGSDLTIKQNITGLGSNLILNQLSAPSSAPTLSTTTSGYCAAGAKYYRITAGNDNGQSIGSATSTITASAGDTDTIIVSWDGSTGATKHFVWRNTDDVWDGDGDYIMEVSAPTTVYTDTCTTTATSTLPTVNTTGGYIVGYFATTTVTGMATEKLCWDGSGQSYLIDCEGSPGDIAEFYGTFDTSLEAGDVVVVDPDYQSVQESGGALNKSYVKKSTQSYEEGLIGVVSTLPYEKFGEVLDELDNPRPIAILGRAPVKVSTENGPIVVGDFLTSASSTPGVAMKATTPGRVIGLALENYSTSTEIGKILYIANVHWYGLDLNTRVTNLENQPAPEEPAPEPPPQEPPAEEPPAPEPPPDCGITSCDASLNLTGSCQNTYIDGTGCGTCTPTCSCAADFSDCNGSGLGDDLDGCETASSTCSTP